MKNGPIILVEDDVDDKRILEDILQELNMPNLLIWFDNCNAALDFLLIDERQPFIILSDINLPGLNGVEFKRRIDENPKLRRKSIPFVFYSTAADKKEVDEAYTQMSVQGFFKKGNSYNEVKDIIKMVMEYWKFCRHPNSD